MTSTPNEIRPTPLDDHASDATVAGTKNGLPPYGALFASLNDETAGRKQP